METNILYQSLPFENTVTYELKEISFIVEISDTELRLEVIEAWRNDMDSTPIELNDKLKNQLLCLVN